MQTMLAVYSPKGPIQSQKLVTIAAKAGYTVRFVSFDLFVNPEKYRGRKATLANDSCLLCGWKEPGTQITTDFDAAADHGERETLIKLLKEGPVSWFELYTNKFNYADHIKRFPRDKDGIDHSVAPNELPKLQAAKSRYILANKGRRKASGEFMAVIASAVAESVDGIVANFVRPSR